MVVVLSHVRGNYSLGSTTWRSELERYMSIGVVMGYHSCLNRNLVLGRHRCLRHGSMVMGHHSCLKHGDGVP